MELLKFITAGNVDDGKSTLIGRLLYDSHAISNDILENIQVNEGQINFAYLTDGLKAEREQGITIDVAYRYFSTDKRKFIIADCPGHKEYTRNMITGASHADAAIVLIDATQGITEQTKRHTFIADLMNIPCIIFCINKMDVTNYDQKIYDAIVRQLGEMVFINKHQIEYIPISALKGDNVVHRSANMKWYEGNTLLHVLENFYPENVMADFPAFMQVQYVAFENGERYFYGTVLNGGFSEGEEIMVLPTQQKNRIKEIYVSGEKVRDADMQQPVAFTLSEDTEIQRGYYIVGINRGIHPASVLTKELKAVCFWMDNQNFNPAGRYYLQQRSFRTYVKCREISEIFDLDNLQFKRYNRQDIEMNTIFKASFMVAADTLFLDYRQCPVLGSFIIIDETSCKTVGAGIVMY